MLSVSLCQKTTHNCPYLPHINVIVSEDTIATLDNILLTRDHVICVIVPEQPKVCKQKPEIMNTTNHVITVIV